MNNFKFIKPSLEEELIAENGKNIIAQDKINFINKIFKKPWGYEYLTYQSNNIGIWVLHVNQFEKTSTHAHFNKDTLLIGLSGKFRIETYNDYHILGELDILYFPKKCFHGIESLHNESILLEIEIYNEETNYSNKNDLLRLRDKYDRDKNCYETSVTEIIVEDGINFHNYNQVKYNDTSVQLSHEIKNNNINILLKGIITDNNKIYSPGTILNNISLSEFTIDNELNKLTNDIEILTINNLFYIENNKLIKSQLELNYIINKYNYKNIGLTSGCFDIFHVGHLTNLKLSSKKCEYLFVCLSSDNQIKYLKGDDRPINKLEDRSRLLSSFNYINYVILYDETNYENEKTLDDIMNIVKPDIWFKGDDYNKDLILKKHPNLKEIILLKNVENVSTTSIINKILKGT